MFVIRAFCEDSKALRVVRAGAPRCVLVLRNGWNAKRTTLARRPNLRLMVRPAKAGSSTGGPLGVGG